MTDWTTDEKRQLIKQIENICLGLGCLTTVITLGMLFVAYYIGAKTK